MTTPTITENTYDVNCLGGSFTGSALLKMSPAIWSQISIEMFQRENKDFIDEFRSKIDFNAVCGHFTTPTNALSDQMFRGYMRFFPNPKLLSTVNLTDHEFFKEYESKLNVDIRNNQHYVEWYNKWHGKPTFTAGTTEHKVGPVVNIGLKTGLVGRKPRQATEEERRQANLAAGIIDPFDSSIPSAPSAYVPDDKLPADAIKHPVQTVRLVDNWNVETPIWRYRDILPNTTLVQEQQVFVGSTRNKSEIVQTFISLPGRSIELVNQVLARIPAPEKPLNPHAYFLIDGHWIAETNLHKHIRYLFDQNIVPLYILQNYKVEICENVQYISKSPYLTPEFIMYFGEILEWKSIDPRLYTPDIVINYPMKVFTKYVFLMKEYPTMFAELPIEKEFKKAYDEMITTINQFISQKESLVDKMARAAFVTPKCLPDADDDVRAYHEELLRESGDS